jgi:condensin complex subunit 2
LKKTYPTEKLSEISTSFCFICLLHLANEQGLKIQDTAKADEEDSDDEQVVTTVGDLWGLQVRLLFALLILALRLV